MHLHKKTCSLFLFWLLDLYYLSALNLYGLKFRNHTTSHDSQSPIRTAASSGVEGDGDVCGFRCETSPPVCPCVPSLRSQAILHLTCYLELVSSCTDCVRVFGNITQRLQTYPGKRLIKTMDVIARPLTTWKEREKAYQVTSASISCLV